MTISQTFLYFALLISAEIGFCSEIPIQKGTWTITESANTKVLTDASTEVAQQAIVRFTILEELVLAELTRGRANDHRSLRPHYVLLPKSLSLFPDLAPTPPKRGETSATGFYLQSDFNPLALAPAAGSISRWETIQHEYVHHILRANFDPLPLWAEEGLAELFSNLRVSKRKARLGRTGDSTRRYGAARVAFLDWKSFFSTRSQDLQSWIEQGLLKAQAYYAQAALLAELTQFQKPELRDAYWDLIERSRFKPITEFDTQLLLGLDFDELENAILHQLKKPFSSSPPRENVDSLPTFRTDTASASTAAAFIAIAYTRSGKAKLAQSLLNQHPDKENPLWLSATSEAMRTLNQPEDALDLATQALDTGAEDPFLITLTTLRLYNSETYDGGKALESLAKARAQGDTSPLMYHLHFYIATKWGIPFERFAPIAKEGILFHPNIEYAPELNRLEANRILEKR